EENIDDEATIADDEREDAAWKVDEMQVELIDEDIERNEMNDNDVQLQNQVVNNLNREMDERDVASDLGREEYLLDVDAIRSEIVLETELEDAGQTNATRDQRDYVVDEVENREDADRNNDMARKNTEVRVEDFDVQLINEANESAWDQEDVVMGVKTDAETLVDIQTKSDFDENLKRVEAAEDVIEETQDRINIEGGFVDDQYDVNIDSKKYTENVIDEIDFESVANDIPRQDMEEFAKEQRLENEAITDELMVDQENELHTTDTFVEDMEYDIIDDERAAEDKREGYELIVDELKEDNNVYLEGEESDIENESHATVNYIKGELDDRRKNDSKADDSADDTIDATSDSVDELREKNDEIGDDNRAEQEAVEEYIQDLKEIDVKQIDEQMKNALGDKFPEGVTEEIYTINDEDGLLETYIVRRVVVQKGAGNVYEKTQSKFGTATYTCNGHGIAEYQWQDETEAAHLVRN
ncbi:hypothetical protein N8987_06470, partial [Crocinitomix sp.]|nr:hypothetical protein [Crocinitomix sp.]